MVGKHVAPAETLDFCNIHPATQGSGWFVVEPVEPLEGFVMESPEISCWARVWSVVLRKVKGFLFPTSEGGGHVAQEGNFVLDQWPSPLLML